MRIVRAALSPADVEEALAFAGAGFEECVTGRRLVDLTRRCEGGSWPALVSIVSGLPPTSGPPLRLFGCYVITYAEGAFKEMHVDGHMTGYLHWRAVACVEQAAEGGELFVAGQLVPLEPGDCAVLQADAEAHEVLPVVRGRRVVLTVGALVPVRA